MADDKSDYELLRAYVGGDAESFSELVRRHAGLVYSAALRQTGDAHLAEDVTQAVFMILSSKAGRCGPGTIVAAWLYRATRFAARDAMKRLQRRRYHESRAAISASAEAGSSDEVWPAIEPLLDDAMASLNVRDQTAVVLRFFENRSLREVGAALGTTEAAASQRVARAVQRLRQFLSRRGLSASSETLSAAIIARAIIPAPQTLSIAAGSASSSATAAANIAKGAVKAMFWTKPKIVAVSTCIAMFCIAVPLVVAVESESNTQPPPASAASASAAPAPGASQTFQFPLPYGGSVQLYVADVSGNSGQVWDATGKLIDPPPFQVRPHFELHKLHPNDRQFVFVVRAEDLRGPIKQWSLSANSNSIGGGGVVQKDGKTLDDLSAMMVDVDAQNTKLDVELSLPLAEWRTLATWGTDVWSVNQTTRDRDYQVQPGVSAIDRFHELIVPLTYQVPDVMNWYVQLFAVRADGQRIRGSQSSTRVINNVGVTQFAFDKQAIQKPEDVTRYELQATPLTKLTMRNVATAPSHATRPTMEIKPPHAFWKVNAPLEESTTTNPASQ